jgi:hypothetical protein
MLPHERSLVQQMEGRPFALLGINCDNDREAVQQVSFLERISWRNWGNTDSSGSLTARYGVRGLPTTYLLDSNGIVRYRNLRGEELDQAAQKLVRDLEAQGGSSGGT